MTLLTAVPHLHPAMRFMSAVLVMGAALLAGCERPDTVQRGYRGLGMLQLYTPTTQARALAANAIPEPEPAEEPDPEAPEIKDVFKNVRVLNDLSVQEFSRLMQALSTWIAPDEGCNFCHNPKKLDSDEKYPKVVARRMLEMTRRINTEWKSHVGNTGVTCWTCHRGQAVPTGDWFANPTAPHEFIGNRVGQNMAGNATVGNSALPSDPLSTYLTTGNEVRIQGTAALAQVKHDSIQQARSTYALMIYMANSLGVNCTYCHNTRAMGRWEESTPQRATAWHGIRMVRDLNTTVLIPLKPLLPKHRLSAAGDTPKVGCETCHKGSYKPLLGNSMLPDYPELAGLMVRPPAAPASGVPGKGGSPSGAAKKVASASLTPPR